MGYTLVMIGCWWDKSIERYVNSIWNKNRGARIVRDKLANSILMRFCSKLEPYTNLTEASFYYFTYIIFNLGFLFTSHEICMRMLIKL